MSRWRAVLLLVGLLVIVPGRQAAAQGATGDSGAPSCAGTTEMGDCINMDGVTSAATNLIVWPPPTSCYFGSYLNNLLNTGESFSEAAYDSLRVAVITVMQPLMMIRIIIFVAKMMLFPREASEMWGKIVTQIGLFTAVSIVLSIAAGASNGAASSSPVFKYVIDPLQNTATAVAVTLLTDPVNTVVNKANSLVNDAGGAKWTPPTVQSSISACTTSIGNSQITSTETDGPVSATSGVVTGYVSLWAVMENSVFPILSAALKADGDAGFWDKFVDFFEWGLMLTPFFFVMGLFAAYLVQTFFYFMVIGAASPLLMLGLIFPETRGYVSGGLRLCMSGALTIVFAAIALGFSSTLICQAINSILAVPNMQNPIAYAAYWTAILSGFISIMLHLLAPKIAANISGAQDSAATAGAVVAGGQFLGAKSLMMGKGLAGSMIGGGVNVGKNLMSRFAGRKGE